VLLFRLSCWLTESIRPFSIPFHLRFHRTFSVPFFPSSDSDLRNLIGLKFSCLLENSRKGLRTQKFSLLIERLSQNHKHTYLCTHRKEIRRSDGFHICKNCGTKLFLSPSIDCFKIVFKSFENNQTSIRQSRKSIENNKSAIRPFNSFSRSIILLITM